MIFLSYTSNMHSLTDVVKIFDAYHSLNTVVFLIIFSLSSFSVALQPVFMFCFVFVFIIHNHKKNVRKKQIRYYVSKNLQIRYSAVTIVLSLSLNLEHWEMTIVIAIRLYDGN